MIKRFDTFFTNESAVDSIKPLKVITEDRYDDMLGQVPPIYVREIDGVKVKGGFAVSEPADQKKELPTFNVFFEFENKFFETEATLQKSNGKPITFANYNDNEHTRDNVAMSIDETWTDPAGGEHSGEEGEDPAAMYEDDKKENDANHESHVRESAIDSIEGFFGPLKSIKWHLASTEDLTKMDRILNSLDVRAKYKDKA